ELDIATDKRESHGLDRSAVQHAHVRILGIGPEGCHRSLGEVAGARRQNEGLDSRAAPGSTATAEALNCLKCARRTSVGIDGSDSTTANSRPPALEWAGFDPMVYSYR